MEGKRGSECLLKSVSNIDFNPYWNLPLLYVHLAIGSACLVVKKSGKVIPFAVVSRDGIIIKLYLRLGDEQCRLN